MHLGVSRCGSGRYLHGTYICAVQWAGKTAGDPDRRRGVCGREACRVTLWLLPEDIVYIEAFAHNTAIYIYSNMQ